MAVTCCLLGFTATLAKLPRERHAWRDALLAMPRECPNAGQCSPGGCRKHCGDYASVAWPLNERKAVTQPKPRGGKKR